MATYKRDSFMRNAEVINDRYIGMNTVPNVPASSADEIYQIGTEFNERPDLLAHKLYGNSRLWWVFAERNPDVLKDPIRDFQSGTLIIVPGEDAIKRLAG